MRYYDRQSYKDHKRTTRILEKIHKEMSKPEQIEKRTIESIQLDSWHCMAVGKIDGNITVNNKL